MVPIKVLKRKLKILPLLLVFQNNTSPKNSSVLPSPFCSTFSLKLSLSIFVMLYFLVLLRHSVSQSAFPVSSCSVLTNRSFLCALFLVQVLLVSMLFFQFICSPFISIRQSPPFILYMRHLCHVPSRASASNKQYQHEHQHILFLFLFLLATNSFSVEQGSSLSATHWTSSAQAIPYLSPFSAQHIHQPNPTLIS